MRIDVRKLDSRILNDIEADAYWCLSKLLDNIHDHYTFSQPGIYIILIIVVFIIMNMYYITFLLIHGLYIRISKVYSS